MSDEIFLMNGTIIPNICFGTDITLFNEKGIKHIKEIAKVYAYILLNKKKKLAIKTLSLPKMINCSMKNGCNMFDTSRAYYGSEYALGRTLKRYPRDSYYIVTKLSNEDQYKGNVREGLNKSLKQLQLDYVDLYLMHWPVEGYFIESWKIMEELYKEGKCKAIGVSNFNIHHLEELKKFATIMPMVNEFECHPLFTQKELRTYCKKNDIQVMAYTSTARMDERLRKTCLTDIAHKYNKDIAQIILRWHQQVGNIPIVNSTKKEHMIKNLNIHDFCLTDKEINDIENININSRLRYDPDNCDFRQL